MDPRVISVFGSSVADGAYCGGNCSGNAGPPGCPDCYAGPAGCYQSRLRVYQEGANRSVFNNCHGGDTTKKLLARFYQFLSTKAGFVVIGLSLANEGLPSCRYAPSACAAVYDSYRNGMVELVSRVRAAGSQPIVASCYPNSGYDAQQYAHDHEAHPLRTTPCSSRQRPMHGRYALIRSMNLLTQGDLFGPTYVPNVNFLGTVDDGAGRWVQGFHANGGHPNNNGSTEMYYAFVPSLFECADRPPAPSTSPLAARRARLKGMG